jgi:hypothetical protein
MLVKSERVPHPVAFDSLASLSVGNGEFAYTVDITGLQTFPDNYKKGVPLGTQSQWGWHSFANPDRLTPEETLKEYDFGRGKKELYATQFKEEGRQQDAANWFRVNPHRLHLGIVGFDVEEGTDIGQVTDVHQKLCLWDGKIESRFKLNGEDYQVETVCHPSNDMIAANIVITLPMLDGLENDCIIKKEEQVLIGIPAEYPTELINNLCIYFDKEKSVDKAFLLWMVRGEEGSYLLILDSKEDPNILYPRIGNFCSRFLKDKMLDIVSANSDFGKNVIKEHKSFYERD